FLIIDGQREEVLARLRFFREHAGGQERGLPPGRKHSAVSLTGDAPSFERELAPRPVHRNGFDIEHSSYSSRSSRCLRSHVRSGGSAARNFPRRGSVWGCVALLPVWEKVSAREAR